MSDAFMKEYETNFAEPVESLLREFILLAVSNHVLHQAREDPFEL
jgi:hypothetical protein